jgi:hypothetical protein
MDIPITYSWSGDWIPVSGTTQDGTYSTVSGVTCPTCGGVLWGVTMLAGAHPCVCKDAPIVRPVDDLAAIRSEVAEIRRLLSLVLEKLEGKE